jgi:hypothetical protein
LHGPISTEQALAEIEAWETAIQRQDARFVVEVRPRLMDLMRPVIRSLPPEYWRPVLELMYQAAR